VGMALYQVLELPLPPSTASTKFPVLIYGGSTATGSLAIQFAKLSGCKVLTTCSPYNFKYVKSLGADVVFDYNSPSCAKDIKNFTDNNLAYVLDCISERGATEICLGAMSDAINGRYASIGPVPAERVAALNPNVDHTFVMGQRAFGHDIVMGGMTLPADPAALHFAKMFWELMRSLLEESKIKVHNLSVNEGGKGLEGVLNGLKLLKERKVSAKKLVYTL
jgi:NADPH:quinone reductase-like Zn-dependent oxidoreductase